MATLVTSSAAHGGRSLWRSRFALAILLCCGRFIPAHADIGCPAGQLPSAIDGKCSKVSETSQLPMDDTKPMAFEAVQDSATSAFVQAIGTITPDTPAQLAKFLQTADAKIVAASSNMIELHSPGGDPAAGLKLGEMIRNARYATRVGRAIHLADAFDNYRYKEARCVGACALAFLGGVDRAYGDDDFYAFGSGISGSGTPAGLAAYLRRMGADPTALRDTAKAERVTVAMARAKRIIFKPANAAAFRADAIDGNPIARFDVAIRRKIFHGMVRCRDHAAELSIADRDGGIPVDLRGLKDAKAELRDGAKQILPATATYIAGKTANDGVMLFKVENLTASSFSGAGLLLWTIENPDPGDPGLADQFAWADSVTAFTFVISADNGERVLPAVLKACGGS